MDPIFLVTILLAGLILLDVLAVTHGVDSRDERSG